MPVQNSTIQYTERVFGQYNSVQNSTSRIAAIAITNHRPVEEICILCSKSNNPPPIPEFQTDECGECGESFEAVEGANAARNGYCSPACESDGKDLA